MKKLFISLFGVFFISAMLGTGVFAEDYLWLEAEDAETVGYTAQENAGASEGWLMCVDNISTNPESGKYSLTFDVQISQTGAYDIWAVTNDVTSRNFSELEWSIGQNSGQNGTKLMDLYKQNMAFLDQQISWTKLAAGIMLSAGNEELEISISSKASGGPRSYMSAVDCVVIVPSENEYVPDASMTRPKRKPHRFAHIEMEYPDNDTFIGTVDSSVASGDKMLYVSDGFSDDGSETETLYYSFTLDEEGEYDIWYLGAETYVMHLSSMKWSVDDQVINKTFADPHNGVVIMNTVGATSDLPIYWQKLGTEKLADGKHVLNVEYTYRSLQGAVRCHVIWADCVIVVPKEWNFTPPADGSAADRYPDFDVARLDARYFVETYVTGDFSDITEDVVFPDTNVLTPGGSTIVGLGGEGYPIDGNGVVTRPYFDQGDAAFDFPVNAEKAEALGAYTIPMTVKALEKYDVGEITVDGSLSSQLTASVAVKLNTSEASDITGSAMLVAALYDSNHVLIGIDVTEAEVTKTVQTLTATVANTENVSGAYLKAYLFNSRELANKLCETKLVQ